MTLKIKESDARRIIKSHAGSRELSIDEMERYFVLVLEEKRDVIVLQDERTEEETRPLLIEDAVIQYEKKERANRRNIAAYTDTSETTYPAYLSVNRMGFGDNIFTAREAGHNGQKSVNVRIKDVDLAAFAEQLYIATRPT